jgi:hypothetical protein
MQKAGFLLSDTKPPSIMRMMDPPSPNWSLALQSSLAINEGGCHYQKHLCSMGFQPLLKDQLHFLLW